MKEFLNRMVAMALAVMLVACFAFSAYAEEDNNDTAVQTEVVETVEETVEESTEEKVEIVEEQMNEEPAVNDENSETSEPENEAVIEEIEETETAEEVTESSEEVETENAEEAEQLPVSVRIVTLNLGSCQYFGDDLAMKAEVINAEPTESIRWQICKSYVEGGDNVWELLGKSQVMHITITRGIGQCAFRCILPTGEISQEYVITKDFTSAPETEEENETEEEVEDEEEFVEFNDDELVEFEDDDWGSTEGADFSELDNLANGSEEEIDNEETEEVTEEAETTMDDAELLAVVERRVYITNNMPSGILRYGAAITMTANLENYDDVEYTVQWSWSTDGVNWNIIPGANELTYTFYLDDTNYAYYWHVDVEPIV